MSLMSTLAFFEASSANSAAQDAANEAREQREFVESQHNKAYAEETRNLTKILFQELYRENGDVTKVNLAHLDRIKTSVESRVKNAMNSYDEFKHFDAHFPTKSKIILIISVLTAIVSFFFIYKDFLVVVLFIISSLMSYSAISAYISTKSKEKKNKENEILREKRGIVLRKLYEEYPNLLAGGIVRKSYLDSIIHDIVEALLNNGNKEAVHNAYKSFFSLISDFKPESIYFNKRFKNLFSFNRGSFNQYNKIAGNN